jgi:hypothetical protein
METFGLSFLALVHGPTAQASKYPANVMPFEVLGMRWRGISLARL